jgi:hypothetical protein
MRKVLGFLCLLIVGDCLAVRADSLVSVTINGWYHNGDDAFAATFEFDSASVYTNPAPGSETDFLYPSWHPSSSQARIPSTGRTSSSLAASLYSSLQQISNRVSSFSSAVRARTFRLSPPAEWCPSSKQ